MSGVCLYVTTMWRCNTDKCIHFYLCFNNNRNHEEDTCWNPVTSVLVSGSPGLNIESEGRRLGGEGSSTLISSNIVVEMSWGSVWVIWQRQSRNYTWSAKCNSAGTWSSCLVLTQRRTCLLRQTVKPMDRWERRGSCRPWKCILSITFLT